MAAKTRKKLPLFEVGPTTLVWPMTLTFNPLRAMIMTYTHAEVQGQRSVGSEDKVKTNGRTDEGDCITRRINGLGKN